MDKFKDLSGEYLAALTERAKKSKVHKPYQLLGLTLSQLLEDEKHKSLYMGMAKKYNNDYLLSLAKRVAEKGGISNKGAYFMKAFFNSSKNNNANGNLDNSQ